MVQFVVDKYRNIMGVVVDGHGELFPPEHPIALNAVEEIRLSREALDRTSNAGAGEEAKHGERTRGGC